MVGCRFESGLVVRSNAVRRGLSRGNAEIFVRAGIGQQGEAFVTDLLGTVTTGDATAEPQAAFEALVGLLMDGTLVVIRQETVPRVLDAPQIRDLVESEDPVLPDVLPPVTDEPGSGHFLDFVVVSEGSMAAINGQSKIVSDDGRKLGTPSIAGDAQIRWITPAHEREFAVSLVDLCWWERASPITDEPKDVTLVAFEDVLFNFNSVVLLPNARMDDGATEPSGRISGLSAIRAVIEQLVEGGGKLLVVGHTDNEGSAAGNDKLALQRANSVLWIIEGNRDDWAAGAVARSYKVDWKAILAWVHVTFGWDCAPGVLDENSDPISVGARARFRARFEAEYGTAIPSGDQNVEDWKAYFVLYERALAKLLGVDADGLREIRDGLTTMEPAAVGYGERWPKDSAHDDYADALNRRVDTWIFADDVPDLDKQPLGADLYGEDSKFVPHYLSLKAPEGVHAFELSLVDADQQPCAGLTVRLYQGDAMFSETVADGAGRVWVEPPNDGPVEVEVQGQTLAVGYGGVDDPDLMTPEGEPDPNTTAGFVC